MSRQPTIESDVQLRMFLRAVADHPWAGPGLIQAYSGLRRKALDWTVQRWALNEGLVEQAVIPAARRAPRRFGLSPGGARFLGVPPPGLGYLRGALLRALVLDDARLLLAEWAAEYGFAWAVSPFTVPAAEIRRMKAARTEERAVGPSPARDGRLNKAETHSSSPGLTPHSGREPAGARQPGAQAFSRQPYRSLRLDGLACLTVETPRGENAFLNAALLVDPGQIGLEWFEQQFRSAYAWSRRGEFRGSDRAFPVFVVIAATPARRGQLVSLWRECAPWGSAPEMLYVTTREALLEWRGRERPWWNERGQSTLLWGGAVPDARARPRPDESEISNREACHNHGDRPTRGGASQFGKAKSSRRAGRALPARSLAQATAEGRLVRDHLQVSTFGRRLLNYVGQYPLLSGRELAAVLGEDAWFVTDGLNRLAESELVTTLQVFPETTGDGYVLAARGLHLLAAQWGHTPAEYARLQRWPLRWDAQGLRYSVETLLAAREHTRKVLDVLVGLRRVSANEPRIRLVNWDHVQCLHEFPGRVTSGAWRVRRSTSPAIRHASRSLDSRLARVKPDAVGRLRVLREIGTQYVDTEFWLEIDRGTVQGRRLLNKLARYYEARGGAPAQGLSRWLPRLLVVVEHDDEARAQALRRRLTELNEAYGVRLDVLITRADLLQSPDGYLDPTRMAWRRPESWSEMLFAFEGLPLRGLPASDPRGWKRLDQRRLKAQTDSRQRRSAAQRARWARMKTNRA